MSTGDGLYWLGAFLATGMLLFVNEPWLASGLLAFAVAVVAASPRRRIRHRCTEAEIDALKARTRVLRAEAEKLERR